MSRTLNLVDRLLALGRNYQQVGRNQEALQCLHRLARFQELPAAVAEEAQARLAEIQLHRCRYRRARRHLGAVLLHQPENARYHYLMAAALNSDEQADPRRAVVHYRKSLELDPNQAQCLREYGLLALRLEQTEAGLQALSRAVELTPDDPDAVADLVEGLSQLGKPEEARKVLRSALFRNPREGRFRRLWQDYQFRQLAAEQQAARRDQAARAAEDGSMLLPFVRPAPIPAAAALGPKRIRHDAASDPMPPHTTRTVRLPEQKHAQ